LCFLAFRLVPVLETYFLYRGKRLITCPETLKTTMVDVAARTRVLFLAGLLFVWIEARTGLKPGLGPVVPQADYSRSGKLPRVEHVSNWHLG
jgi:hypothetical protein